MKSVTYIVWQKNYNQTPWLIPVILATQKAETGRIKVQGHPRQKVSKTPILANKRLVWYYVPVIQAM
jgi:hypothetical protein